MVTDDTSIEHTHTDKQLFKLLTIMGSSFDIDMTNNDNLRFPTKLKSRWS